MCGIPIMDKNKYNVWKGLAFRADNFVSTVQLLVQFTVNEVEFAKQVN